MKLMRAPNLIIGQHWVNVLATAGIACELHNRYLNGALGDIPADQCAPELWLVDERDEAMARRLIDAALHGPAAGSPGWRCRQCGEALEAQFTVCWQCGTARDPQAEGGSSLVVGVRAARGRGTNEKSRAIACPASSGSERR